MLTGMLAVKIAPVNCMNLVTACGRFINETFHIPYVVQFNQNFKITLKIT